METRCVQGRNSAMHYEIAITTATVDAGSPACLGNGWDKILLTRSHNKVVSLWLSSAPDTGRKTVVSDVFGRNIRGPSFAYEERWESAEDAFEHFRNNKC